MGRAATAIVKPKRPVAMWPEHSQELCRGVNDTWNSYQRAHKGRTVTTAEWKSARSSLWIEQEKMLHSVDVSSDDGAVDVPHPPVGMKRSFEASAAPPPDLFCDVSPFEDSSENFAKRPRIPGDWENGEFSFESFDEWSDNFIIVSPDELC